MKWHDSIHHWSGAPWEPRAWQSEALPWVLGGLGTPSVVRAIMGAGKSILIAELCAVGRPDHNETIVVSTPRVALVDQLAETIAARCGAENVGRYYTHAHEPDRSIVVACTDSLKQLAGELLARKRKCVLWIADECHRTENRTAIEANELLSPGHLVGFTATPYRAEARQSLSLYEQEIYSYGAAAALRDGVVVPWRVVHWMGGETRIDEACVDMCRRGVAIGPGVVNALTIDDAEAFHAILIEAGVNARTVHSDISRLQVAKRLDALEKGEIDCVVHVSMLQEGIDLPWLRWLCLRRPVGSKVRFAQEVGRVLRCDESNPEKVDATIYDPHDLFGTFKLEYEALLGLSFEPDPENQSTPAKAADVWAMQLELWLRSALAGEWVSPMSDVTSYLRELTCALEMTGAMERHVASRSWRTRVASISQRRLLTDLLRGARSSHVRRVPAKHRRALKAACLCAARGEMKRGESSDLISVMLAIKAAKGWPRTEVG